MHASVMIFSDEQCRMNFINLLSLTYPLDPEQQKNFIERAFLLDPNLENILHHLLFTGLGYARVDRPGRVPRTHAGAEKFGRFRNR